MPEQIERPYSQDSDQNGARAGQVRRESLDIRPDNPASGRPTGGEWRVATRAYNDHWRGDGTEVLSDYGRIAETHCSGLRALDECRANARLIAAAPNLLEALECLLPGLILDLRYADPDDDRDAMQSRIKTVTDALAKAYESQQDGSKK